jgi:glyoxylase-like metal-dependent hydrolase (beta-lactamase superfamily II)
VLRAGDSTHLFSGDSLFPGGPGNTDKDASRFAQLMDDLERRVFGALPDDTWVYPGHGADTTLGASGRRCRSGAPAAGSGVPRPHAGRSGGPELTRRSCG